MRGGFARVWGRGRDNENFEKVSSKVAGQKGKVDDTRWHLTVD